MYRRILKGSVSVGALLLPGALAAQTFGGAIIDNGTVQLGINDPGNLIISGIGLTFLPSIDAGISGEALAPGCYCEGWGIGDRTTGSYGMAGADFGYLNVTADPVVVSGTGTAPESTGDSAVATATVAHNELLLGVTHTFAPSASANLYQVGVEIENQGTDPVGELIYRRAMDWDIPPLEFSEYVTIQGWPAASLIGSSDDGFVSGNINVPLSTLSPDAVLNDNFSNSGPADHGAAFDFSFGELAVGDTYDFRIFYGAAPSEADAIIALGAVGAEVYSLGKVGDEAGLLDGTPHTFIFGFAGVGGTPVSGGATTPINQFAQMAEAFVHRGRDEASARIADYSFGSVLETAGLVSEEPARGKRRFNLHLGAFAGGGSFDATTNNIDGDYDTRGVSLAADTILESGLAGMENALAGVQVSYGRGSADLGAGFGTLESRSRDLVLYGRLWGSSALFAEGMLNYGRIDYTQERQGITDVFTSSPEGTNLGALLRIGRTQALPAAEGRVQHLSYYGELATNRTRIDAATENNMGLTTGSFTDRQNHAGLGLRYEAAQKTANGTTVFGRVDVAALFEFGDDGYSATQTTAGGAVLTALADPVDGAALRLRGTIGAVQSETMTAAVEYSGLIGGGDYRDHRLTARFKIEF